MLHVSTFGGYSLALNGIPTYYALGDAGRQLSAFLFVNQNRYWRKERLEEMFWGEMESGRARRAMNTALWRIRTLLAGADEAEEESLLISSGNEILLRTSDRVKVDACDLERHVEALALHGEDTPIDLAECQRLLTQVANDYKGPFLDGLASDWALVERERLHCLYLRALLLLMGAFTAEGRYELALDCARRSLAADPLRESVQRHAMRLYVLNGQRVEALRQYERCRRILKEDCAVDPMPETRALYDSIASGAVFGHMADQRALIIERQDAAAL